MKNAFLLILFISNAGNIFGQAPPIEWAKCLGGSNYERSSSVCESNDSGYVVAGMGNSLDFDMAGSGYHGNGDFWIVKLNGTGNIQWTKCYGGTSEEEARCIRKTTDGGYVIAGVTESHNGDVTGYHDSLDCWLVKIDSAGSLQWQKCFGGSYDEWAWCVRQTNDGGYITAGFTNSFNGDVTGNHGNDDYWIVKFDSTGIIQWAKCFGGSNNERAYSVCQTTDLGYAVAGFTFSNDGDVTNNHGAYDIWVIKLDTAGNLQWQKCFGGTNVERNYSIEQTPDGGYVVAGDTYSNDGDVSGNHGMQDGWLIKLDNSGNLQWQNCIGGSDDDSFFSLSPATDGGYILAGETTSGDYNATGNHGIYDSWAVKTDSAGVYQWHKCLGGSANEYAGSIEETYDGGYILTGWSVSYNGDVTGNHFSTGDYWTVKLMSTAGLDDVTETSVFELFPNPVNNSLHFKSNFENATVTIKDVNGKTISITGNVSSSAYIYVSDLPAGFYMIEVKKYANVLRGTFIKTE